MAELYDPDEIRRTIDILKPNNALYEARILNGYQTLSGYFRGADALIRELDKLSSSILKKANIYLTLQELHPGCEARVQWECFMDSKYDKFPLTSNNDILTYKFVPVDLDPIRPTGISSTMEELRAANELSLEILSYMQMNGWRRYVKAFSGNGYHLLFYCDIPKTEHDVEIVLSTLDELFSNDACKVDTTLSNPARIIKLYGTFARKGRSTADRPHRLSKIIEVMEDENT